MSIVFSENALLFYELLENTLSQPINQNRTPTVTTQILISLRYLASRS